MAKGCSKKDNHYTVKCKTRPKGKIWSASTVTMRVCATSKTQAKGVVRSKLGRARIPKVLSIKRNAGRGR